jgi:ribosomal protein L7/L12
MSIQAAADPLDPLAAALRARGFELFVAVRVASPIERKISVIKEVRSLTGVGLKQAKDAVEQEQVILESLAPDQAERVSERLAAAGGHSALLLARAHLHAFRPDHPHRGAQICERLTVVGGTLALARGQIGAWVETVDCTVGDGELLTAIDHQCAKWAAAGWCEAGSELELLRRVSARDEQLEAHMREAEGEALLLEAAVYGDWMQAQGDPRGLIASAALSLDAAVDEAQRAQRAAELAQIVAEHAVHVLGPARGLLDMSGVQLGWCGPSIVAARLGAGESAAGEATAAELEQFVLLERLLSLPACADLRTLALEPRFSEHAELAELLARSPCASSLRSISVVGAVRATFTGASFERLEQLELAGNEIGVAGLSVPALRRLALELRHLPAQLEPRFVGLDAPQLEHFELATQVYDYWDQNYGPLQQQLAAVLRAPAFAQLRSLTLRSLPGSLPYHVGLAPILARLPARRTLEQIDLRGATLALQARAELEVVRSKLPELLLPEPGPS